MKKISSKEVLFLVPTLIATVLIAQASDAQAASYPQAGVDNANKLKLLEAVRTQIGQQPISVSCSTGHSTRIGEYTDVFAYGLNPWTKAGASASWTEETFGYGSRPESSSEVHVGGLLPLAPLPGAKLEFHPPFLHILFPSGAHKTELTLKLSQAPKKGEAAYAQLVQNETDGKPNASIFLTTCYVKMFW